MAINTDHQTDTLTASTGTINVNNALGVSGGSALYEVVFQPVALTGNRTVSLPDSNVTLTAGTSAVLGTAQTFTAAQTFRAVDAVRSEAAATQDAIVLSGRAGGTGSFAVKLTPATLGANRTVTFPDGDVTLSSGTTAVLGAAQTFTAAQTFRSVDAIRSEVAATQDAIVLAGRAGGTGSFAVTLAPTTLGSNTTLTLPNVTDTVATIGTSQTFTAAQTFRSANSVRAEAAATQDAVVLAGRAGGTGSFDVTLTPGVLSSSQTITLPDATGTLLLTTGSGSSLTFGTGSLSLAGNLTTSGAFATTLTATATTSLTLPTSGTLLTTTGSGSSLTFGTGSLSLAGNLTTSGAFATTLTATATTSLTLPTSGTLATRAGAETLTNKILQPSAGTATAGTAPLKFTSGTNLTAAEAGAVEYDGAVGYLTPDTTIGRGFIPATSTFRLTTAGSAIGNTIANFFGTTSNIPLVANAFYEIDIYMLALRGSTAGTATITLTNSAAPTLMFVDYEQSPLAGIAAPPGSTTALTNINFRGTTTTTTAAYAFTTGTLTASVNHYFRLKLFLRNGTGTSLKIQMTAGTGNNSMTPQAGSVWFARRLPDANTGTFAA